MARNEIRIHHAGGHANTDQQRKVVHYSRVPNCHGGALIIFEDFSPRYAFIKDPTFIRFCKIELNPMLIGNRK